MVYWVNCDECGELIDEFDERWPDGGFEHHICKTCQPAKGDDDDN